MKDVMEYMVLCGLVVGAGVAGINEIIVPFLSYLNELSVAMAGLL